MGRAREIADLIGGTTPDIILKTSDGAILNLQTSDTTVTSSSVLGAINFQAPDEASGTDSILIASKIEAIAEDTFAADNNKTKLVFSTGASAAADSKFEIASDGSVSTPTAGTSNLRLGVNAGNSIASGGNFNVTVGDEAGTAITTGDSNTLVGYAAGDAITTSGNNVAVGTSSMTTNILSAKNVALGVNALKTHDQGTATESFNVAVGHNAAESLTTGTENTIIGGEAGDAMTDADRNTVVGYNALTTNTKSDRNTAIGRSALENLNHTSVTSGLNVAVGHGAGSLLTTGEKNTIIGSYSGNQDSLDIRTADSNIVLADGDGNTRLFYKTATLNWNIKVPAASNNALIVNNTGGSDEFGVQIVNSTDRNDGTGHFISCVGSSTARFKVFTNGNAVNSNNSYGSISDEKLKENIVDSGSQWDDIKALKVRKFSMKEDKLDAPNKIGVIAQELEASGMNGLVIDTPDLDNDLKNLGTVTKTVKYSILYMKAVKALQEAMTRIETLESKVKTLEDA